MVAWGKRDSERSPRLCANHRSLRPRGGAGESNPPWLVLFLPPFQGVGKLGSLTRGCIRRLIDPRLISIAPPGANLLLRPGWPFNPIP
jgi:hypothetical protein